ncbi:ABC transporter ATP-binding protein [Neorhizobium galegae]|uniref:ABC transporter ATP-binding protein n=1 Tax=Neorhizobium galegae TaxID=399 RepID=UPI000622983F|nr:ABC transporter ATP-binding protein [Neorhizobium galegae]KAB1120452.1 ABC transporter ATP-binding protein [Neorhizobium galegae]MCQ1809048.1 ABC transporter ATP-binding protein [Neorhizobium galegae]CDZ63414.1 ABC-type nitrate/sulfonate/bicarbonate transport system, ATPase component [Neorhizobium galegae bv. orientalis]
MLARDPLPPAVFEVNRLTLEYPTAAGTVRAVDDVSFRAGEGERLALLGPSGCGKSSILKAVAGFLKPASGAIKVRGRDVKGPGPDRIVVFQEFDQLLPWKTVRQNVEFPLRMAAKLSKAEIRERTETTLKKVGLERVIDSYPHTLSGGMKQRAAIARALVTDADVLLMDEPFAALDALTRSQLQRELLELAEELGFTLLFVTHSIEEAILIGTKLHLLSPHPGRTITSLDSHEFGREDIGTARLENLTREVHDLLFSPKIRKGAPENV